MKRCVIFIIGITASLALITGCNLFNNQPVPVGLKAALTNQAALGFRSIDMGNGVTVDTYSVTFYKIEIGNSEEDKFTLWESTTGETKDLVSGDLTFDSSNGVVGLPVPGEYQYCRLTIGETLSLAGTVDTVGSGSATTVVTGNYAANADGKAVFLFGTADSGATGDFLLTAAVTVQEGSVLTFSININGTVTYTDVVNLDPPTITFADSSV